MKIIPFILLFISSYIVGLFAFGQILILLFRGIPKTFQNDKLNKVPLMVISIIIWFVILYFLYPYTISKFSKYSSIINIGLIVAFLQMLYKSIRGGKDIDSDLNDTYKL